MTTKKEKPEKTEEEKKMDKEIVGVIHLFELHINPACKQYYARPVQRQAAEGLIKIHGFERVEHIIKDILPATNKMTYLPTITTPLQLWEKYASLESNYHKLKQKAESRKPKIIT